MLVAIIMLNTAFITTKVDIIVTKAIRFIAAKTNSIIITLPEINF